MLPLFFTSEIRSATLRPFAEAGFTTADDVREVRPGLFEWRRTFIYEGNDHVRPVRLTRLVEASFSARDPKLAADCVNELAAAFIDLNINMKYAATEQATTFLSEQIKGLQTEIEQKENQLQGFEAEANIVALSDTETTVIDRLSQLNKALTEAQIERSQKEARPGTASRTSAPTTCPRPSSIRSSRG